MLITLALLLLGAGPAEPAAPRPPAVPEAKVPEARVPDTKGPAAEARTEVAAPPAEKRASDGGLAGEDKAAAGPERKAEARADAGVADAPPVPPALTRKALCGEFVKSGKELAQARKRLDDDKRAVEADRQALEKLKVEIAESRLHLRAETERLERLLARRAEGPPSDADKPAGPAADRAKPTAAPIRPQELDALARTVKSMKPEAAAALIQKTELPLAAAVLKRMKANDAGAVMDRLKPDLAAELMALMATLPSSPAAKGGRP